jgi:hypothetical protein
MILSYKAIKPVYLENQEEYPQQSLSFTELVASMNRDIMLL